MREAFVLFGCIGFVVAMAMPVAAQQGINWSDDPSEWPGIKEANGKVTKGDIDFDDDPPYGITGFDGPLTSEGAGPVSPGVVLENVVIDTLSHTPQNLASFGPFLAWGNPSNGIVANHFTDALEISLIEPNHSMVMLNLWDILGSQSVDVSFYDKQDKLIQMIPGIPAPEAGHPVLFWTQDRDVSISRISMFDPAGGAEGIMETEYWIPEPVTLLLLGVGGLLVYRRRRAC